MENKFEMPSWPMDKDGNEAAVSSHHQACRDCVFAIYTDKTQTGCFAGRLDKFKAIGKPVLECVDEEGLEFFVINDAKCNYHRTWPKDGHDLSEYLATVKKETQLAFEAIIPLSLRDSLEDLDSTVDSLAQQTHKPARVTIVLRENLRTSTEGNVRVGPAPSAVTRRYDDVALNIQVREPLAPQTEPVSVDDATVTSNSHYYLWAKPGQVYPPDFFLRLNSEHNEYLRHFLLIEPVADGRGLVVHTKFSQNFNEDIPCEEQAGTFLSGIVEKAKYITSKNGQTHLIRRAEDLCPSLLK